MRSIATDRVVWTRSALSDLDAALAFLVLATVHQLGEAFWPSGFRFFTNAHVFRSGNDDWPVSMGGATSVNGGFVRVPLVLAVLLSRPLRRVGPGRAAHTAG